MANELAPPHGVLRRHLVEEADDAGESSVDADGRDVAAQYQRVVADAP
jgi:hypothetical protein